MRKSILIVLAMAGVLGLYGYIASMGGHDHSQHGQDNSTQDQTEHGHGEHTNHEHDPH